MNKVDIYVNGQRLDVFQDEEINLNISVQNVQDISKVFTDFTQGFTIPATPTNNAIFGHYYRTDVSGTFDGRLRQSAFIEINSLPFRSPTYLVMTTYTTSTSAHTTTLIRIMQSLTDSLPNTTMRSFIR